jgi:hypothetical protein
VTIRTAKPADMIELLNLMEAAHARSVYAGVDEIDRDYTRQMFTRAMHFNGHSNAGAVLFLISEKDGKIEGYFFGLLDRVYQIGKKLAATDVHFYLSADADPRDAIRIIDAYLEWCEGNPKVVEVRIGESNAFGEPDPRFAALLERKGFTKAATVFTKKECVS